MKKCLVLIALAAVSACQMVHRVSDTAAELFGDAVVARVGEHRLMRSELAAYIPAGVSSEDRKTPFRRGEGRDQGPGRLSAHAAEIPL